MTPVAAPDNVAMSANSGSHLELYDFCKGLINLAVLLHSIVQTFGLSIISIYKGWANYTTIPYMFSFVTCSNFLIEVVSNILGAQQGDIKKRGVEAVFETIHYGIYPRAEEEIISGAKTHQVILFGVFGVTMLFINIFCFGKLIPIIALSSRVNSIASSSHQVLAFMEDHSRRVDLLSYLAHHNLYLRLQLCFLRCRFRLRLANEHIQGVSKT